MQWKGKVEIWWYITVVLNNIFFFVAFLSPTITGGTLALAIVILFWIGFDIFSVFVTLKKYVQLEVA